MDRDDKHLDGGGLDRVWNKVKAKFLALSGDQVVDGEVIFQYNSTGAGIWAHRKHATNGAYIGFSNTGGILGYVGMTSNGLMFRNASGTTFKIWNENNDGADSGLDADKLDGQHASYFAVKDTVNTALASLETAVNTLSNGLGTLQGSLGTMAYRESDEFLTINAMGASNVSWANGTSAGPTLNVKFADLLTMSAVIPSASASYAGIVTTGAQTFAGAKTFNGALTAASTLGVTGDTTLSSNLYMANDKTIYIKDSGSTSRAALYMSIGNILRLGFGTASAGYKTQVYGAPIEFRTGTSGALAATIDNNKDLTVERHIVAKSNITAQGNMVSNGNVTTGGNVVATGGVACNGIADLTLY